MFENMDLGFEVARSRQQEAVKEAQNHHFLRQLRQERRKLRQSQPHPKRAPLRRRVACTFVPVRC